MATNKVVLRTVEEFMADYTPTYKPLYPLLLSGKSQAYPEEVGKIDFKRLNAVGDIRAKPITPKDTEMRQIGVKDSSKTFTKYFLANQYIESALQKREDIEGIVAQVLDEHQKQADEMMLLGDGTAANNVVNNGLYHSADENYDLEDSEQLRNAPDTQTDFYDLIMGNIGLARDVPGRKAIIAYGATTLSKLDSLLPELGVSLKKTIDDALESDETIVRMPKAITPANSEGWIIVSLDQVKTHYCSLPALKDQGVNSEKMYAWFNFLMGSSMVEVLTPNAIIRQPVTFEA